MFHAVLVGALALAQQTDTTFAVRPNSRLELETFSGRVVLRAWDRNQVRVQAEHGRRDRIEISTTGSVVQIEGEGRMIIDYQITVPSSMSLEISGTALDIDVQGVQGEIEAETIQGNITVSGGSRVHLESIQGQIVVSSTRGRIEVSTANRGIHLSDVGGEIVAETVNGSIIMERVQSSRVEAETVNGTIVFDGAIRDAGDYTLATHNGSIWLVVPPQTNASISVATFNGRLDSSFPVNREESSNRRRFTVRLGNGSATVDLETFSGSVRLRRPGETRPTFQPADRKEKSKQ